MNWVRRVFARGRVYGDLSAEIREHLEEKIEELVAEGMPRKQAEAKARKEFGNVMLMEERGREVWQWPRLESFITDVRYGLRMLRKSPGFTTVAVLTLALGIGANTAIFSAVNGIWLEPLLNARFSRTLTVDLLSMNEIRAIQKQSTAFERTTIYRGGGGLITGGGTPVEARNIDVSGDFFSMLGVKPLLGRFILPPDTQPGHDLVAVMSYPLWMDDFGGDTRIVGRSVTIDQKPYTVIGVMPKGFDLGVNWSGNQGVWMPYAFPLSDPDSGSHGSSIVARLRPGASVSQAKSQLDAIYSRLVAEYPKLYPKEMTQYGRYGWLVSAGIHGHGNLLIQLALSLLFAAVGFVLLMTCVNVASLLVGRSWSRQRELTIRRTLGATRFRIVRQLLTESLLLAIAGGALGLFFSIWGIRVLRAIAPPYTPRIEFIRLDANVFWYTLVASLLTAILIGLTPALHATSRRVGAKLKGGLSGSFAETTMRQSRVFRSSLVVLELALAMIVVVGGALMARSFYLLMRVDTGVHADHVITMAVHLSDSTCHDSSPQPDNSKKETRTSEATAQGKPSKKQDKQSQTSPDKYGPGGCYEVATTNVLAGLQSLSGVQEAAMSDSGPLQGGLITTSAHYPGEYSGSGLYVEGRQGNQLTSGDIEERSVTPDFFATLGIKLLRGRSFEESDKSVSQGQAIVSESFARKYIPGNPVGRRFNDGPDMDGHRHWMQIVGEVNDVRDRGVNELFSGPAYYTPFEMGNYQWRIIARTSVNPTTMVPAIERVVRSVDPDAPITHIETVDQIIAESSAQPRFQTVLLGSFGVLGLLLAMIGIYGVISYSVVQRTHEIGVRMALGAGRGDVLRMILGEGLLLAFIGIAIGIAGALALTRFLRSLLFEIKPSDPVTYIGVAMLLAFVALAACWIPARRAMKVDPMVALRYE